MTPLLPPSVRSNHHDATLRQLTPLLPLTALLLVAAFVARRATGRASAGLTAPAKSMTRMCRSRSATRKTCSGRRRFPASAIRRRSSGATRSFCNRRRRTARSAGCICVDTKDGSIRWQTAIPGSKGTIHKLNSLASSTPATDGERVYSLFWDGKKIAMYAHDFKGKEVWKRDLGDYESQHGVGHSPMVYDGKVIFANDQDGSAMLIALDAKNGETVWEAKRKAFRACYSTPFVMQKGGGPDGIDRRQHVRASPATIRPRATENWDYTWKFTGISPCAPWRRRARPAAIIFVNSGDGDGSRHTIAVKAGSKGEDISKNLVWEDKKTFPYVPTHADARRPFVLGERQGTGRLHGGRDRQGSVERTARQTRDGVADSGERQHLRG